jgi:tetratricopeptide (TPR) repeat protein
MNKRYGTIQKKHAVIIISFIMVTSYSIRCIIRNPAWKDDLTLFSITARTSPNSARAHHNLGHLLMNNGLNTEALNSLDRAIEIAPFYGSSLASRGEVFRRMGKPEDSVPLQEKALSMEPDYYPAHFYLAEALRDIGKKNHQTSYFKSAVEEYITAVRLKPTISLPYIRLGELYLDYHKNPQPAEEYFRKAHEIDPESTLPLIGLGRYHMRQGDHEEARKKFEQARYLLPEDPRIIYYQGLLALKEKNILEAEKCFLQVLQLAPEDPVSYINLAQLYEDTIKKPNEAITYYKQFLDRFPNHSRHSEIENKLRALK